MRSGILSFDLRGSLLISRRRRAAKLGCLKRCFQWDSWALSGTKVGRADPSLTKDQREIRARAQSQTYA